MKTFYTLLLCALFIGNASAQNHNFSNYPEATMNHAKANPLEVANTSIDFTPADRQGPFDTIWYEDFGAGISSWAQSGVNQIWRRTFQGSTGQFETDPTATINSTTKANGCLIFDADSFNTVVNVTAANYIDLSGSITSPSIDLSSYPNVIISFQQFFRLCCQSASISLTLSVSGNGGTTWTDFDCIGSTNLNSYNQSTSVPSVPTSINISNIAGGQSNVQIRFTFAGASTYLWQIDDIVLTESPNNDVINQKSFVDFAYNDGGYYTITPRAQVAPITFRSAVFNNGGTTQTNVKLNVDVSNGSSIYNQNSNILASFNAATEDTLSITTPFTPTDTTAANYTVVFSVDQDQTDDIEGNNSMTRTFAVSDTVYARDNGLTTTLDIGPGNYNGGGVDGAAMANLYEFPLEAVATSVSVFIDAGTSNNVSISAGIWDASGTAIAEAPDAESDLFDITSPAQKNKWVTLPLISPFTLNPGGTYVAGIRTYGVTPAKVVLFRQDVVTEQPRFTSWVLIGSSWSWVNELPAIRLNIQAPDVNTGELNAGGLKLYQNMPNPYSNTTLINYEIAKNDNVTLDIFDITGKKVVSIAEGDQSAGAHAIEVMADLLPGVYFYTLKAGEYSLTKKMTVLK
jgi:hypothetical protein